MSVPRKLILTILGAIAFTLFMVMPLRAHAQEPESCPEAGQKVEIFWASWLGATNNPDHQPWTLGITFSGVTGQWTLDRQGYKVICLPEDFNKRTHMVHFVLQDSDLESNKLWLSTLVFPHYWTKRQVPAVYFGEMPFWTQSLSEARSWGEAVQPTMMDLDVTFTWVDADVDGSAMVDQEVMRGEF